MIQAKGCWWLQYASRAQGWLWGTEGWKFFGGEWDGHLLVGCSPNYHQSLQELSLGLSFPVPPLARLVMLTGGVFQRKLLVLTGHTEDFLSQTQISTKRELNHQKEPPNAYRSGKSQLLSLAMTPVIGLSSRSG